MDRKEWYFEYEIQKNRPGLLGDISSLLGMLSINIVTINGVNEGRRGLLLKAKDSKNIERLESILSTMDTIKVIKIREPKLRDRLAVRHGRYIQRDADGNVQLVEQYSYRQDERLCDNGEKAVHSPFFNGKEAEYGSDEHSKRYG